MKRRPTKKGKQMPDQPPPSSSAKPIPIVITEAEIKGTGGSITGATITGNAQITGTGDGKPPGMPPGIWPNPPEGQAPIPGHPILLPPPSEGDQFWMLIYCTEPPPPHWEWISFTPGDPPERPQPEPPPSTTPPGIKPFPPDGGWGFAPPWGWIYWPGPEGAGPK